ncbi:hypothetical protein [Pedobacter jejuensis]|uniref:DUF1566 domain-containing protein n=1 Tax=Pedobacter jejuensis TaxID=1268550 RepID=A0A3N0BXL4_9SPHI|nr:hypothetical protein [Pedobacter jejuensis]RNL54507.1 hypothetical protein D7004_06855 [Pedobacter jejuensis]
MKLNLQLKLWHGLIAIILLISSCSKDDSQPLISIPTVSTSAAISVTTTTATVGGSINSTGGSSITEKGICYSTSSNPTIANNKVVDASGNSISSISIELSKLIGSTTYYVRAYATNAAGTAYGSEITFATGNPIAVGELYGGGMIFYVDATGKHGLIVAPSDQSSSAIWGCEGTDIPGTSEQGIGFGLSNTQAIVNGCKNNATAAAICYNLVLNGFDDWYLPTVEEIKAMNILFTTNAAGSIKLQKGAGYMSSNQDYRKVNGKIEPKNNVIMYVFKSAGDVLWPLTKSESNLAFTRAIRSF